MEEDKSTVAAADGFRLFIKELPGHFTKGTVLIPLQTVTILEHLWKLSPKEINPPLDALLAEVALAKHLIDLRYTSSNMLATWGKLTVFFQLVQGTFPNYRQLIPESQPTHAKFFAPDMAQALKRLGKISNKIIRLEWFGKTMNVAAREDDHPRSTEVRLIEPSEGRIALDQTYLNHYTSDKQGIVDMGISTASSPIAFKDDTTFVMVMPMFVQWEGELAKEETAEAPEAETMESPVEPATDPSATETVPQKKTRTRQAKAKTATKTKAKSKAKA
jgi:DNA polymerase III sliding clamp (beta) subunit (PCNA family)